MLENPLVWNISIKSRFHVPPPTEPVICIHETLGRGPEWLCDDYVEARPVTVGLFIRWWIVVSSFFPPSYITFEIFYINKTESKLVPPPTQWIWPFWCKILHPMFVFIPRKHAAADRTALPSTRPTCPWWGPPQRRAKWGPSCGRSTLPLSSCQLRSAEMTSCYSSSSADHRPPEKNKKQKTKETVWKVYGG